MSAGADPSGLAARLERAGHLNAVISWSREALEAESARLGAGAADTPLGGMPVAIKDNIATGTLPTTCGSRILDGYTSPYAATVVERLRAAGGLVACTTNLDEFAMGSSTEFSAFGRVRHPDDPDRVPGGSSGGSAALVAAGVVPAALGSETGGSVRQPAAFCGCVGVKPTYGRVSRFGLVAFGSSLDCVSVFGATVAIAGKVLAAIAGPDPRDATSARAAPTVIGSPRTDLRGLTVGLPAEYLPATLDPGVRAAVDRVAALVRDLGGTVRPVSLPNAGLAVPAYYVIAPAEAAANLARFDGVRFGARADPGTDPGALYRATRGRGFGAEVRRRILVGTYVLSAGYYDAYYGRAVAARRLITDDFRAVFDDGVDLLLTPTTPTPAFRAGEKTADPVAMYLADVFVTSASLAGLPAMSLPAGRSDGLPVGVQLMAPRFAEGPMLAVAGLLEQHLDARADVR